MGPGRTVYRRRNCRLERSIWATDDKGMTAIEQFGVRQPKRRAEGVATNQPSSDACAKYSRIFSARSRGCRSLSEKVLSITFVMEFPGG